MHSPDETVRTTAHHTETEAASLFFVLLDFQAHRCFLF